jgi:hypothetical protein
MHICQTYIYIYKPILFTLAIKGWSKQHVLILEALLIEFLTFLLQLK